MGLGTNEWACMRTASQRKLEGLRQQVLKLVENLTKWRRPPIGDLRLHHFEQIVSWMLGKGGHEQDIPPERIEPLSGPSTGAKGSWDSNRREAVYGAAAPFRTPSKRSWWGSRDSNPDALRHMILNHARLPIPTLPRAASTAIIAPRRFGTPLSMAGQMFRDEASTARNFRLGR